MLLYTKKSDDSSNLLISIHRRSTDLMDGSGWLGWASGVRSRVLVLNLVSKLLYKLLSSHIHNPGLDLWSEQIADLLLLFFRKKKCKQQPNKHVLRSTLGETISRSEHFQDDLLLNCGLGPIRRMKMLDQSFGERNLKTEIWFRSSCLHHSSPFSHTS